MDAYHSKALPMIVVFAASWVQLLAQNPLPQTVQELNNVVAQAPDVAGFLAKLSIRPLCNFVLASQHRASVAEYDLIAPGEPHDQHL
jgi:hypothetical protein